MGVGVFNIGQNDGRRLTKILPAKQTRLGEFFGVPFRETTFSTKHTQRKI